MPPSPAHNKDPSSSGGGVTGFLSGLKDKVAGQVESKWGSGTGGNGGAFEQISNVVRQSYVAYGPSQSQYTQKLQICISTLRGFSLSTASLSTASKRFSKSLYLWGQSVPGSDFKDISDRFAFFIFQSGQLEQEFGHRLEQSRQALKDVRGFEEELTPRREKRMVIKKELQKIENYRPEKGSSAEKKYKEQIKKLRSDLAELESSDSTFEASVSALKRQKLDECMRLEFSAMQEFGEKLAVLASYGKALCDEIDVKGGEDGREYENEKKERVAVLRGMAEEAIQGWSPSNSFVPVPNVGAGASSLNRTKTDTRSFGLTHAHELNNIEESGDSSSARPHSNLPAATTSTTSLSHPHAHPHSPSVQPVPHQQASTSPSPSATPATAGIPLPEGGSLPPSLNMSPPPLPGRGATPSSPTAHPTTIDTPTPIRTSTDALSSSATLPPTGNTPDDHQSIALPPPEISPIAPGSAAPTTPPIVPELPTVAETGQPIVGTGGPKSGSLTDRRQSHPQSNDQDDGHSGRAGTGPVTAADVISQENAGPQRNASASGSRSGTVVSAGGDSGEEPPTDAALRKALEHQEELLRNQRSAEDGVDPEPLPTFSEGVNQSHGSDEQVGGGVGDGGAGTGTEGGLTANFGGGIDRMASTSRRRLERNEGEFGAVEGAEAPPSYSPWAGDDEKGNLE